MSPITLYTLIRAVPAGFILVQCTCHEQWGRSASRRRRLRDGDTGGPGGSLHLLCNPAIYVIETMVDGMASAGTFDQCIDRPR